MAKKPNYAFERNERARLKAAKKAERAAAKSSAKAETPDPDAAPETGATPPARQETPE